MSMIRLDVVAGRRQRRAVRDARRDAIVEVAQLAQEGALPVYRRLGAVCGAAVVGSLDYHPRKNAAREAGRIGQQYAPPVAVHLQRLPEVPQVGQVDPGSDAAGAVRVFQRKGDRAPVAPDLGTDDSLRHADQDAQPVQVVDRAAGQQAERALYRRGCIADRLAHRRGARRPRSFHRVRPGGRRSGGHRTGAGGGCCPDAGDSPARSGSWSMSRTARWASSKAGSYTFMYPAWATVPAVRCAAVMASISSSEKHSGFSMNRCLPACRTATAASVLGSVWHSSTASRSNASRSRQSVTWRGT